MIDLAPAERFFSYLDGLRLPRRRDRLFAAELDVVSCAGCGKAGFDQEDTPAFGYCGDCFARYAHCAAPCTVCGRDGAGEHPPAPMTRVGTDWSCEAHLLLTQALAVQEWVI